jgi:hypothetical protein
MAKTEKLVAYTAALFLIAVFSSAFVIEATKKPEVWEIKVFEVNYKTDPDTTYVYSFGSGYRVFDGKYELLAGKTYRITYVPTVPGRGRIVSFVEVPQ